MKEEELRKQENEWLLLDLTGYSDPFYLWKRAGLHLLEQASVVRETSILHGAIHAGAVHHGALVQAHKITCDVAQLTLEKVVQ
jgi:hypothetical protein